jgi:hypothetical protein
LVAPCIGNASHCSASFACRAPIFKGKGPRRTRPLLLCYSTQ